MLILNICLSHENLGCIPLCKKSEFLNRWIQIIVFFVLYNFGNKKMSLDYFYSEIPCHRNNVFLISLFGET